MLKPPRFCLVEKRLEKTDNRGASARIQKQRIDPKKVIISGASWRKLTTRPSTAPSLSAHKKSAFPRLHERDRARIMGKEEKIDASSTESTNLSEREKVGSVLALRREIDEWRRQEELRSNVNQVVLERSAWITDTEDNKRIAKVIDSPKCTAESSTEEANNEVEPETKDDMSSARSRSKSKSKNQDRENIPVTWISVRPEASAKTSLRSVADYLSAKDTQSPLLQQRSKRRLCLSPKSLSALENAEKLVEDAERQLSQMNLDAVLADDDFERDGLFDATSAYIRNTVASIFETGMYEPSALPPTISETLRPAGRSKSKLSLASASRSGKTIPGSSQRESFAPTIDDECLLCCRKSTVVQAPTDGSINSDKLSVQRGPAISIKANLCIQTSRIVDIRPTKNPLLTSEGGSVDNVANFEFHHESLAHDNSATASGKIEAPGRKDATTSITGLVHPVEPTGSQPSEPSESQSTLDMSSDVDLSLGEPTIITELDVLLSQQRTIIRKVHQSSQALDELLRKNATNEDRSRRSSDDRGDDYSTESFDSRQAISASSRESCKSNAGYIENLKSSSLQIPKPSCTNLTVVGSCKETDEIAGSRIDKKIIEIEAIDPNGDDVQNEVGEDRGPIDADANSRESKGTSDINTNQVDEGGSIDPIDGNQEIDEKDLRDAVDVSTNKEINEKEDIEDSLHQTSHLIDSLSDDQSIRQLSIQLIVQNQLDSKAMNDNDQHNGSTSVRSVKGDAMLTVRNSVDLGAREHSSVSNDRLFMTAPQHNGISLLEPPSSDEQKLSLLKKLESCSIPARYRCVQLPFTSSTVLSDAVRPTGSTVESSELSSEAITHSEGELYLSSSASYSLGEVRRQNPDSSRSRSSSIKVSSTGSAVSQLKTSPFQCSIGEFVGTIEK